jgi:hypothetical protein
MNRNRESSTGQKRTETEPGPIGAFHAVTEFDLASGAGRVVGTGIGPPTRTFAHAGAQSTGANDPRTSNRADRVHPEDLAGYASIATFAISTERVNNGR